MKILIPMAGEGSRFVKEGFDLPKPLIDVAGKPMIQVVVENLHFDADYIFLVRSKHLEKHSELESTLTRITNGRTTIVKVDALTEGAACTALLAREHIDNGEDLLIANSDQIIRYMPQNFNTLKDRTSVDGIVFTFNATHPKWSFVKIDSSGFVTEVAEKNPISDIATCGIYWYRKGSDFVRAADRMIQENIRVNNEFYIAPIYNQLISQGKTVIPFFVQEMHGVGTPEDLREFLRKAN